MLVLPISDPERARRLLGQVAGDRRQCSIIVFGDTERARVIAARADIRAQGHPFRKVVRVPALSLLGDDVRFAALVAGAGAGADAVAMTARFRISRRLQGAEALDFAHIERAFARALAGEEEA